MQYIKIMINIIIKLIWAYNIVQELIYTRVVPFNFGLNESLI